MTVKILPILILSIVLVLLVVFLTGVRQGGDLGAQATEVNVPEEMASGALSGRSVTPEEQFDECRLLDGVQMQVWENRLFVASDESLEVNVALYEEDHPLQNREPVLYLTLPDGAREVYYFPPTNEEGQATLALPPVSAPNGALIAYEVCLQSQGGANRCVGENYLIWNYQ